MAYRLRTNKTWGETETDIREQLRRWGAATYSLSRPNFTKKTTRSWVESPEEALVVLKADWKSGRTLELSYNKQARAVDNARVLFLVVEALRLNETRGIDELMREAYLALPPPTQAVKKRDPWEVLGLQRGAPASVIRAAFRALAMERHPDKGGSTEAFRELQESYEAITGEKAES